MCGIVAYVGEKQAYPILIKGLQRLAYRGYDSAGIAISKTSNGPETANDPNTQMHLYKKKGESPKFDTTCRRQRHFW